jgi:isoquinoline 1-oxidoreductase beta subunit
MGSGPETTRREFVGFVLAGATLTVTAGQALAPAAAAAAPGGSTQPLPSNDLFADRYDFPDMYRDACVPTNHLLTIEVHPDGTAHFDLPRQEVGQGITTSFAQVIADEMDLPIEKVDVTLADARPELIYNQLTGGSTSHYSLWQPVRQMAATARTALAAAAAEQWGVPASSVSTRYGAVFGPDGQRAGYGALAVAAAAKVTTPLAVRLKAAPGKYHGQNVGRVDARAAVTGAKKYTMDLAVPQALPTMICRPPTINGTVQSIDNLDRVRAMPGVTDVGAISTGVAVRARTFGQCIDAIRALRVTWNPGTIDGRDTDSLAAEIAATAVPMVPAVPGAEVIEETYTCQYRSGSPMEPNCAIADVRGDTAEVWGVFKLPIITQQRIALMLDLPEDAVTVHCVTGGGSFGRHLFSDGAYEAAEASKLFGKPVRLMWHRTDDARHGRMHPLTMTTIRATRVGNAITSFELRCAASATDVSHGLGEIISGSATAQDPRLGFTGDKRTGNAMVSGGLFHLLTQIPYYVGPTDALLSEAFEYDTLPTSAVRNVWSPDLCCARELFISKLADGFGMDDYESRRAFLKNDAMRAVLDKAAEMGDWGRTMPEGTAQAIGFHAEYKAYVATFVEIDARPAMVKRRIREAYTGPRITKCLTAIDIGNAINPRNVAPPSRAVAWTGLPRRSPPPTTSRTGSCSRARGTTTATRGSGTSPTSSTSTCSPRRVRSAAAPARSGSRRRRVPRPSRTTARRASTPPSSRSTSASRWVTS